MKYLLSILCLFILSCDNSTNKISELEQEIEELKEKINDLEEINLWKIVDDKIVDDKDVTKNVTNKTLRFITNEIIYGNYYQYGSRRLKVIFIILKNEIAFKLYKIYDDGKESLVKEEKTVYDVTIKDSFDKYNYSMSLKNKDIGIFQVYKYKEWFKLFKSGDILEFSIKTNTTPEGEFKFNVDTRGFDDVFNEYIRLDLN